MRKGMDKQVFEMRFTVKRNSSSDLELELAIGYVE